MAKKGLILCVCQGTCPSFKKMDTFEVLNAIRREKIVDFVSLHPQLCADDGDRKMWLTTLRETWLRTGRRIHAWALVLAEHSTRKPNPWCRVIRSR